MKKYSIFIRESELAGIELDDDSGVLDALKSFVYDILVEVELVNGEEEETAYDIVKQIWRDEIRPNVEVLNDGHCCFFDQEALLSDESSIINCMEVK